MRDTRVTQPLVIYDARSEPTIFQWFRPDPSMPSQDIPRVKGFYYSKLDWRAGRLEPALDCQPYLEHAIRTSLDRVEVIRSALGAHEPVAGDAVFCDTTGPNSNRNIRVFAPLRFGDHVYPTLVRGALELPAGALQAEQLTLVTGLCLFSNRSLRLLTDTGEVEGFLDGRQVLDTPVREIVSDPNLSFYEAESTARLIGLAAHILNGRRNLKSVTIVLDVPRVQYYCYLLDAFGHGLISAEQMRQWFRLVSERHALVLKVLRQRLQDLSGMKTVAVKTTPGLDLVEPLLVAGLGGSAMPTPAELFSRLGEADEYWQLVAEAVSPKSYRELVYLSYATEQLRHGLIRDQQEQRLAVDIENRGEYLTFELSKKIMLEVEKLHPGWQLSLLGLYPMERTFSNQNTGRSDHYLFAPANNLIADDGTIYSHDELLSELFGQERYQPSV